MITGYQTRIGIVRLCAECWQRLWRYERLRETPIAGAEPSWWSTLGRPVLDGWAVRTERDLLWCDACEIASGTPADSVLRRIRRRRLPEGALALTARLRACGLELRRPISGAAPTAAELRRAVAILRRGLP